MKSIVVPASGRTGDRPAMEAGLRLATLLGSHVTFLHVREDVVQLVATMVAGQVDGPIGLEDMRGDLERDGAEHEAHARQEVEARCAEHGLAFGAGNPSGVSATWDRATGVLAETLVAHARTADLIVMGSDDFGDALSHVLVEAGRPVLFAPATAPAADAALLDLIVIAWNDTAEAARAVTACLPLLPHAHAVALMAVADADDDGMRQSCERLADTLRRHGPSVSVTPLAAGGRGAGEVLLEAAQAAGASLLVMGGFSHSRLRQLVFGGFTRDLLATATMPVLIAH